jgi:pyoverdine/dityrosine biosynthesis protein Dit1
MIQDNKQQNQSEDGLLFRMKAFTYVYSSSTDEIHYVSKRGQSLLELLFGDSSNAQVSKLLATRSEDREKESASKDFLHNLNNIRVFSSTYQESEHDLLVTLYEKTNSLNINGNTIRGTQGVCILRDAADSDDAEALTFEDEMCYVQVMLAKSQLIYCLPSSSSSSTERVDDIVNRIISIFEETIHFGLPGDAWLSQGRSVFADRVKFFVARSLPILFTLPAFPCKSPNSTYKVLGELPDKGEELALQNLFDFCAAIEQVYPPGAKIDLTSDGTVFSDVFGVKDETVAEYDNHLKMMVPDLERFITFFDLSYFFDHCEDLASSREELLRFSGRTSQYWEEKIQTCEKTRRAYIVFRRVAGEEHFHFKALDHASHKLLKPKDLSHKQMDKVCQKTARWALVRNDAYNMVLDELMPFHVRFSIHSYDNSGPKFSIRLLKSVVPLSGDKDDAIPTPWHNVIVETREGKFIIMKKFQAEKEVGESNLVYYKSGWASHYKQQ